MKFRESSSMPISPRRRWAFLAGVLILLAGSLASWIGFDQRAISCVVQGRIDPDSNLWVESFTLLGKAWLQIWLLLIWFLVSRRRREVLAGILALILIATSVDPLKLIVGRVRPYSLVKAQEASRTELPRELHSSFPSGDTASAFGVAQAVAPAQGWAVRLALLGAGALVGGLRVTALAHYPSDVLAGAAIGLLAGWLAIRLIDRWGHADRAMPFEGWLVWGGIIGLPVGMGISEGADGFLLFLKTYGVLVSCVLLAGGLRDLWRRAGREVVVPFLARNRQIVVSLAVLGVIVENVLSREKPYELFPFDEAFSPRAAVGAALVLVGVLVRLWSSDRVDRPLEWPTRLYAWRLCGGHIGPFLVVCGLLTQLNDWMNWPIVMAMFALSYGAFFLCRGQSQPSPVSQPQGAIGIYWFAPVSFPPRTGLPSSRGLWRPRILAWEGRAWTSLVLISLPVALELFVEDFVCETLMHMH